MDGGRGVDAGAASAGLATATVRSVGGTSSAFARQIASRIGSAPTRTRATAAARPSRRSPLARRLLLRGGSWRDSRVSRSPRAAVLSSLRFPVDCASFPRSEGLVDDLCSLGNRSGLAVRLSTRALARRRRHRVAASGCHTTCGSPARTPEGARLEPHAPSGCRASAFLAPPHALPPRKQPSSSGAPGFRSMRTNRTRRFLQRKAIANVYQLLS